MKKSQHPSSWLNKEDIDLIRTTAREGESLKQLHAAQLDLIHREGWLKMFVPKKFGGLELTLPEVLQIEEALAWADGSVAWVVTLCAGAAWFAGFLDPELAKEIFLDDHVFFAGSGAATGSAERTSDGYLLNGAWKHASGASHATIFTANFIVRENDTQTVTAFLLKKEEVTVRNTWNSVGMIATGSHSFEVKNCSVFANRKFEINPSKAVIKTPIYRYPFLQLAETTLAVNLSGLTTRFIELAEEIIQQKGTTKRALNVVERSSTKLNECRSNFHQVVLSSWKSCVKKNLIPRAELKDVSKASQNLAKQSLQIVDRLYPHCGLAGANQSLEINRVWRNIHTASQHSLFRH